MSSKGLAVALQAFVQIRLSRHAEDDEVSFSIRLPDCDTCAQFTGGSIVGANVEESLAERRIGIYGNYGNALLNGPINLRSHELGICRGDKNACWLSCHSLAKRLHLGLRVITVGSRKLTLYAHLVRSTTNARCRSLPIRQLNVDCYQVILFFVTVIAAASKRQQT